MMAMTPLQGGLPQNRTDPAVLHGSNSPKFCAPAQQRVFLHTRSRISGNFGVIIPTTRPHAQEKKRGTPSGLPGSHGMRMPVCVFEKNDGDSPAPNGHPPVRTGQQLCPNRSRWPKKARDRLFSAFAPPKTILYTGSIRPRGRCKTAPRAAEALPIRRRQRRERFHPSDTRKHRKHCLDFSPARGSGRSHAPAEFLLLKHAEPYAPKDLSFLPAAGKLPIA